MVLWEITLGTAYFLGLKRTYKLALKIQRRLISPKYPKIRQFAHRRTRAVFDVAVKVHKNIQQRDIEVGRNLGNWILRWLDRMKPSAQIRGHCTSDGTVNRSTTKHFTNSSQQNNPGGSNNFGTRSGNQETGRHMFTSSRNMFPKAFPTIATMMSPMKPAGTNVQYRKFSIPLPEVYKMNHGNFGYEGLIRNDIKQWILKN